MSDQQVSHTSSGIGFTGALFLVFLVLKLCHVIDWSWWWVTCPLWAAAALLIGGLTAFLLLAGLASAAFLGTLALIGAVAKLFRRKERK